jgi:hypothetical protein
MRTHVFLSDKDGNLVNPTFKSCPAGGYAAVTIASNAGRGPDVACLYCRLQSRSGNGAIRVRIGGACISSTGILLPDSPTVLPYAVTNLSQLFFYGATNSNIVDIEYFI